MKLDSYRNSQGQIWVNVASSTYVLPDFVNLDNNIFLHFLSFFALLKKALPRKYQETIDLYRRGKKTALLIRHDCRKPLFFPDQSVDHILCSHFLEHVFPMEATRILQDFRRVLKPGSTLHIVVPDLKAQAEQYLARNRNGDPLAADEFIKETLLSRESRGSLKYRFLQFLGAFGLQHHWMYDSFSMAKRTQDSGFEILDRNDTPSRSYRVGDGSVHLVARKR